MIEDLNIIILLPILAGLVLFLFPDRFRIVASTISSLISLYLAWISIRIYNTDNGIYPLFENLWDTGALESFTLLSVTALSRTIILFIAGITLIINIYSIYRENNKNFPKHFFSWFLLTAGCSYGVVLADNLLMLLFFWGVLGYTLYRMMVGHDNLSSAAAKKTFIIVGSSDAIMIIGIALIWNLAGTFSISEMQIPTQSGAANMAFIMLAIGSFTKAGAFPFHSWIPDYTKSAHGISSAFMPASLDKLVGIYFLILLCTKIFSLNEWLIFMLIVIGVLTIIIGVMMALIQHDFKKLLGYHAVSQVGYMILGIGLGSPLGIAAGLFHMINNAIYKSGLFLSATSIHRVTGTTDLDKTGGLATRMPITFVATLIFALSISGIPPLNGFASKWMIYQGIVDFGQEAGVANNLWIIWLALAVFGSALTLASFVKFLGGIFLGEPKTAREKIHETGILQWLPKIILAIICIGFGAFATNYLVSGLFMPVSGSFEFAGMWDSSLLFWLVLVSILLGFLIYFIGDLKNFRRADTFIGGEKVDPEKGFPITSFYNTIKEFSLVKPFYKGAEKKYFDLYDLTRDFVLWNNKILSRIHNGVLTLYMFWIFGGLVIILLIMML